MTWFFLKLMAARSGMSADVTGSGVVYQYLPPTYKPRDKTEFI